MEYNGAWFTGFSNILRIGALVLILFLSGNCKKESGLIAGFQMPYQAQFTIQPGIGPYVVHHFYLKNIQTRYQTLLAQNNRTNEEVKAIALSQAVLSGVFADADYGFIQNVSLRIYNEDNPNDWLEIAYRDPTPLDPGNALPLIPNEGDFKRFLSASRYSLDLALTLRATTAEDIPSKIDLIFTAQYED